jgi:hypothetical protein
MKRGRFVSFDYSMFSSYMGRWTTVIAFAAIVLLALGAIFLKSDDMAHVPVVIGVSAFDSVRSAPALESLADFCRGKGCGDVTWRYLRGGAAPSGCDFYLMTSLELSEPLSRGALGCALIVSETESRRYSVGAVVVRAGTRSLPPDGGRIVFSSPLSATGFLSPYRALVKAGYAIPDRDGAVDFAGLARGDERVVLGVVYGAYDAGGVSEERLRALEASGCVRPGEIDVLLQGEAYPEIVLASDPAFDSPAQRGFARRFPAVYGTIPSLLHGELACLGIAGFHRPRRDDVELIKKLSTMVPPRFEYRRVSGSAGTSR